MKNKMPTEALYSILCESQFAQTTEEVRAVDKQLDDAIRNSSASASEKEELDSITMHTAKAYEYQGFLLGLRAAKAFIEA